MRPSIFCIIFVIFIFLFNYCYAQSQITPQQQLPLGDNAPLSTFTLKMKLKWQDIENAKEYLITIARDPELLEVVASGESTTTEFETPSLSAGTYYYLVEGFSENHIVGKNEIANFYIRDLNSKTAIADPLPAPQLIEPLDMQKFIPHLKIRLSWKPVEGAKGYRVKIYNEGEDTLTPATNLKPLWITEVPHPWLIVHDVPYASFVYLDTGVYRWEVSAIHKESRSLGDSARRRFQVSRQYLLKNNQWFLQLHYGVSPLNHYHQNSAHTGSAFDASEFFSQRMFFGLEGYVHRNWGMAFEGGAQTLPIEIPTTIQFVGKQDTLYFPNASITVLYRHYLSPHKFDWVFTGGFGGEYQEFLQPNNNAPLDNLAELDRPRVLGPRLFARISRRWNPKWEFLSQANTMLPVYMFHGPTDSQDLEIAPFNGAISFRSLYYLSPRVATGLSLQTEYKRLLYSPHPYQTLTTISFLNHSVQFTLQMELAGSE